MGSSNIETSAISPSSADLEAIRQPGNAMVLFTDPEGDGSLERLTPEMHASYVANWLSESPLIRRDTRFIRLRMLLFNPAVRLFVSVTITCDMTMGGYWSDVDDATDSFDRSASTSLSVDAKVARLGGGGGRPWSAPSAWFILLLIGIAGRNIYMVVHERRQNE